MRVGSLVARAAATQAVGRVAGTAISFAVLFLTVRYLGPEDYGLLTSAVVFVGVFETFTELGLGAVIVRRVAGGRGSLHELVGLSLGMTAVYALPLVLVTVAVGLAVYHDQPEVQLGVALVALGLLFRAVSDCYEPVCQVTVRFGAVATADVLSRLASLAFTAVVVAADLGLVALFAGQVLPHLVRAVVMMAWARRVGRFRPVFAWRPSLSLLREGVPFALIIAIGVLYFRADGVMLSLLSDPAQVGAYGLAYRVAVNLSFVGTALAQASYSTLSEGWADGSARGAAEFRRGVSLCFRGILLCALPVAVTGPLLASDFVRLVGSDDFVGVASTPMALLFVAVAAGMTSAVLGQALAAAHEQGYMLRLNLVNLAVNIALNFALIPTWGAVGAGVSLVVTELCGTVFALTRLARVTGFRPAPGPLLRVLPPLGMALLVYALASPFLPFLAVLALLVAAYGAAVVLVGPLDRRELLRLVRPAREGSEAARAT